MANVKEIVNNTIEAIRERFSSPMYSYFILSWLITNWKFIFILFFVSQSDIEIQKLDYLTNLYLFNNFWNGTWSVAKLFFIPAISSFVFVWWLSLVSEMFFKRNEIYKRSKETIIRLLEYKEKVEIASEQRKIRDEESDKPEFSYNDNEDFNNYLDEGQENIELFDSSYLPSEILYNTDFESYKDKLKEFSAEQNKE